MGGRPVITGLIGHIAGRTGGNCRYLPAGHSFVEHRRFGGMKDYFFYQVKLVIRVCFFILVKPIRTKNKPLGQGQADFLNG